MRGCRRLIFLAAVSVGTAAFFVLCGGAARRGGEISAAWLQEKAKQGLSFEWWRFYPAGTEAFIFFNLGRLRGGQQREAC